MSSSLTCARIRIVRINSTVSDYHSPVGVQIQFGLGIMILLLLDTRRYNEGTNYSRRNSFLLHAPRELRREMKPRRKRYTILSIYLSRNKTRTRKVLTRLIPRAVMS